jgi:tRNA (guanine37-N1)-methyltransferase
MKFDIVTIFPRMFERPTGEGVVARGLDAGVIDLRVHDLRDFTTDRHRVVDDVPYGGGPGMVMKPEPFFRAVAHIRAARGEPGAVLLTSPQGRPLTDRWARTLATQGHVVILCGRYEGVDDRVRAHLATEEISIGDYVLSGGELAAMVIVDVVSRLVPGVVGDERSVASDSFARGLLDHPHYTRPADFEGWKVPEVLLSGHHGEIARWRAREAVRRTRAARPDLLAGAELDALERAAEDEAVRERAGRAEGPAAQDEGAKS